MDLIIGGAYQGKVAYAMEKYKLTRKDISYYDGEFDPECRCICYPEDALFAALAEGEEFVMPTLRPDAVVICTDISCGVVPVDRVQRRWREETGRMVCALARQADSVTRIFCGLPMKLK